MGVALLPVICKDRPQAVAAHGPVVALVEAVNPALVDRRLQHVLLREALGHSGLGREGSHHSMDDYVEIKYLCLGDIQV